MSNTLLMLCIPFAGLLLCIAVMPLVKPEWWEKHQAHAVILWSLLFAIPFALFYGAPKAVETVLECLIGDYLTFIVLLFGLFCVAGNIKLEGSLVGNPKVNVIMLAVGTFFSSCIGTTGASMLFVRPIIQMNSWRKNKRHIMVFFIFLVSNIGGCLTPIGDPPLLMGFSRGVSFFWSMRLFPVLVLNMILLLTIFYHLDKKAYQKDITKGLMPEVKENEPLIRIKGAHNFLYIVMIVIAVILSGVLPKLSAFQNAAGEVIGIPIFREVTLTVPAIIEIAIILLAALLSFKTTPKEVRVQNHFTWGAIQEVAVLFIGIFITMQPALMVLKSAGSVLESQSRLRCSGQQEHFQASSTIHRHIWFSLLQREPCTLLQVSQPHWEWCRSRCLWQFRVALYLWEPTHILEMHRTLWSSHYQTKTVSTCHRSLVTCGGHCVI